MKGLEGPSETTKLVIPIAVMLAFIGITNWNWQDGDTGETLTEMGNDFPNTNSLAFKFTLFKTDFF